MYVLQWNESTNVSNMFLFIEFSGFSCNKGYEKKIHVALESKMHSQTVVGLMNTVLMEEVSKCYHCWSRSSHIRNHKFA